MARWLNPKRPRSLTIAFSIFGAVFVSLFFVWCLFSAVFWFWHRHASKENCLRLKKQPPEKFVQANRENFWKNMYKISAKQKIKLMQTKVNSANFFSDICSSGICALTAYSRSRRCHTWWQSQFAFMHGRFHTAANTTVRVAGGVVFSWNILSSLLPLWPLSRFSDVMEKLLAATCTEELKKGCLVCCLQGSILSSVSAHYSRRA